MIPSRTIGVWTLLLFALLASRVNAGDLGPSVTEDRRAELIAEMQAHTGSADDLWSFILKSTSYEGLKLRVINQGAQPPPQQNLNSNKNLQQERAIQICAGCREFCQKYPSDPRGSAARLLILQRHGFEPLSAEEYRQLCQEIISAPEAPRRDYNNARTLLVLQRVGEWRIGEEAEKVFSDYERDYPDNTYGAELVRVRLRYYASQKPQEVEPMLRRLITSPNKATALRAQEELTLRTEPLDLRFTAVDGRVVDVAQLRGRVVLLYFWATWGDPNNDILPLVSALRRTYDSAAFQIIGICLDADRSAMKKAIESRHMDWPDGNDTVAEKGSAIAWRFGGANPQTAWVIDRNGIAHQVPPRGDVAAEVRNWIHVQK